MTLFQAFQAQKIDTSLLGLAPGEKTSCYDATPKGARVIGWAGVDGIHFCFIPGFGDMVFSINPMEMPDAVHPVAATFSEFLCLLLACYNTAAIEQAHAWNQLQFQAFLNENPPGDDQLKVLKELKTTFSLSPVKNPFHQIKTLQAEFDYTRLPACLSNAAGPPHSSPSDWHVYFHGNFWSRAKYGHAGIPYPLQATVQWGDCTVHIPSAYLCPAGLVLDLCIEVAPETIQAFLQTRNPLPEEGTEPSIREEWQSEWENPLSVDLSLQLEINGRKTTPSHGASVCWISCLPEGSQGEPEARHVLEHYGYDPQKSWIFYRAAFPWATRRKPVLRSLRLLLEQRPCPIPGTQFTAEKSGETISILHPLTGTAYCLTIHSLSSGQLSPDYLHAMPDGFQYPTQYQCLSYSLSPALSSGSFSVTDCSRGDSPRQGTAPDGSHAAAIGVIGSTISVAALSKRDSTVRTACSALYFDPPAAVQWQAVFYEKKHAGIVVELLSGV